MKLNIEKSWLNLLDIEFNQKYFLNLTDFVKKQYKATDCFPKENQIFAAFNKCTFNDIKVVIIGQDPFHGIDQANGLCFSVNSVVKNPPSLINIFKEINSSFDIRSESDLSDWANQGVLLLCLCLFSKTLKHTMISNRF